MLLPTFAQAASKPQPGPLQTLTVLTQAGTETFKVETATTREQRDRGLMFRTHLPDQHGMLFDFGPDQEVRMWMKNTLIPLDMVFITADGHVHRIERNTEPRSLRVIPSEGPVRYVLELKGGAADKYGIKPGDRIAGKPDPKADAPAPSQALRSRTR
ncbi:DUF192 domain-containing protein [Rhodoplanes sp. Z2-YC6860]|uniref:DUF192 domain-containing protein n=1 Tax=Rhodoplanes sp. Z2-YC6860 TaxID=674703 RepID=UPI001F2189B0|nr:DUF192 domain-containing protein [Rhodoplanes sp. Z2-YC6860]